MQQKAYRYAVQILETDSRLMESCSSFLIIRHGQSTPVVIGLIYFLTDRILRLLFYVTVILFFFCSILTFAVENPTIFECQKMKLSTAR